MPAAKRTQKRASNAPTARQSSTVGRKSAPLAKQTTVEQGQTAAQMVRKGQVAPQSADPAQIAARLAKAVPEPRCELTFETPFQLLIATILSAQSTDKTVNAVTPALFARFSTPAALAAAEQEELEALIKRTGFFRNKSKAIRAAAQKLVSDFGGEVPRTIEQLITLQGVARKTANVVLGTAYGINAGFVVDTHIARVAQRLGLTQHSDPAKIEQALCAQFPQQQWSDTGHRILLHGRYTCLAKAPMCTLCPLNELCPSRLAEPSQRDWTARAHGEAERVRVGMAATVA